MVSEAGLRDLYAWSGDLLGLVLREAARATPPAETPEFDESDYAAALAEGFRWLATLSPNYEHRAAISSLNDRCHVVRVLEPQVIAIATTPFQLLADAVVAGQWRDARRLAVQFPFGAAARGASAGPGYCDRATANLKQSRYISRIKW